MVEAEQLVALANNVITLAHNGSPSSHQFQSARLKRP